MAARAEGELGRGQRGTGRRNTVELFGERVLGVDDDDLPVGLAVVDEGERAEHLDLCDLPALHRRLADFEDVERVVIADDSREGVDRFGVLVRLRDRAVVADDVPVLEIAQRVLLHVLLERVEMLLCADFDLVVGASRNFADHVDNVSLVRAPQWNRVPWRNPVHT